MSLRKLRYFLGLFSLVLLTTALAACQTEQSSPITRPGATAVPATGEMNEDEAGTASGETTQMAEEETTNVAPISDEEARQLMVTLSNSALLGARKAIERILAADDQRFIPVLIELFRAREIGMVSNLPLAEYARALKTLSGQSFGLEWPAWIEWYGKTDLAPPPGFTTWKGLLLSPIDARFAEFLQDSHPSRIRVEEIQWGGVGVDGIPALDNPSMLTPVEATYMNPFDPVFGIALNGDARAYPLRMLDWHEMANDVVGGVPVSLAYCTLCGAAIAYDGRATDGNGGEDAVYTFGSSGFLFRSNKLMYDRPTRTLWNQLTGEPVLGELAATDVRLNLLPVVLTSWEEWQKQHPDTLVVDIDTGFRRDYSPGAAYGHYFTAPGTMFPVWQRSNLLDTKAQVYTLTIDSLPKAYPLDILVEEKVVNDMLGDTAVVLIAARGLVEVDGNHRFVGPVRYPAGAEVRAYDRGDETFHPGPDAGAVLDAAGRQWRVTEEALVGPDGQTAARLSGHLAYWFGWFAFFPNTLVYGQ